MSRLAPVVCLLVLLAPRPGRAEEPVYAPSDVGFGPADRGSPPPRDPPADTWAVDVLLGLPAGVRAQRVLGEDVNDGWVAEGFVGMNHVFFPSVGTGLRRSFVVLQCEHSAFFASPGVDAYLLYNTFQKASGWLGGGPSTYGLLTADIDIGHVSQYEGQRSSRVGVKLGLGTTTVYGSRSLPVGSMYFGWLY